MSSLSGEPPELQTSIVSKPFVSKHLKNTFSSKEIGGVLFLYMEKLKSSGKTATTEASMLISSAAARLAFTSCRSCSYSSSCFFEVTVALLYILNRSTVKRSLWQGASTKKRTTNNNIKKKKKFENGFRYAQPSQLVSGTKIELYLQRLCKMPRRWI